MKKFNESENLFGLRVGNILTLADGIELLAIPDNDTDDQACRNCVINGTTTCNDHNAKFGSYIHCFPSLVTDGFFSFKKIEP